MATENRSISGSDELTSVDSDNDFLAGVDTSDTTDGPGGTTKKIKPKNLPVSTATTAAIAVVQSDIDTHEANTSNPHSVTKSQVGLGNADNTSDANKPVSTAQQTALDLKQDKLITPKDITTDYTLIASDKDKFLTLRKGTAGTITIPDDTLATIANNTQISGMQADAGQYTFLPGSGVTIQCYNSRNKTAGQYAGWTLIKISSNTWWLEGNLTT